MMKIHNDYIFLFFLPPDFCAYVTDNAPASNHVITANEGNSVALASGYHLATGKSALVYLQVNIYICTWTFSFIFSTVANSHIDLTL
jgi:hypothetical protein